MAKKKTQSRLSLFGQMLLSYCVCLIMVAAFVGSTIYARVFRDYRREVEELSAGVMVQYAEILQTRVIDPAEGCALDFMLGRTSDITVQKVLSSGRLPLHVAYTYKADFGTALKRYIPLVSDIRVYNARANMFLSKTVGLYYIDDHTESNAYPNRWLDGLRAQSGGWLPAQQAEYPGMQGWQLCYAVSYPLNVSFEDARGYIMIDVNESFVRDILNSVSSAADETLLVADTNGQIISSQNAGWIGLSLAECGLPGLDTLSDESDIAEFRTEDGDQTLCYSAPLSNGWRVLRILPTGVFYASLNSMRTSLLIAGFAALGSFRPRGRWDLRRASGILFGCAGALALLAILVPALLRADALFAHEMAGLFTWELPELRFPTALGIGLVLTPFACSLLWRLAHPRAGKAAEAEREPRLPAAVFLVSLVTLDGLYALFLGVQSAGLFGGPAYLAERGLGYAEWARSGFFQMVRVTVVNLSVLLGAVSWTKRERGFGAIRIAAAVLTGESLLLLGSAAWRMSLYVSAYGLSFKRCMTYWGMAVMAALFAFAAGKLAKPERSFCRLAFPFLFAAWLVIAYLPVDAAVARDQVRRGSGDAEYLLYGLSYDALGYLDGGSGRIVSVEGGGSFRRLGELVAERRAQAAGECGRWESWSLSAYLASRGGVEGKSGG